MTAKIDQGRDLDWEIEFESSLATRFLSAVAAATSGSLWRGRSVLSTMAVVAGPLLRGRVSLQGASPTGNGLRQTQG